MKRIVFALALSSLCSCVPIVEQFEGSWAGTISETYQCSGADPVTNTITDVWVITQAEASVQIQSSFCGTTNMKATVSSDVANLAATSCSQTFNGDAITFSLSSGTLTLPADQMSLSLSGTVSGKDATGSISNCPATVTSTLTGGN